MTAQKDQLQSLIAEIDRTLQQPSPKFPWQASAQTEQYRQALQQTRNKLYQMLATSSPKPLPPPNPAQDVMASMVKDMQDLRTQLLQPLHAEVATLTQQRNALMREVRQLEAHRQTYLNERATQGQLLNGRMVENLQQVHDRADQVMSSLDTSLRVVFESLQRDIASYQDSLTQGLNNLHSMGRQSEAVFSGLVSRLAEQLGRDASVYLRSQDAKSLPDPASATPAEGTDPAPDPKLVVMPYAGAELPPLAKPMPGGDSITTLTQLLEHLTLDVEPVSAAPAPEKPVPPVAPEKELPPELLAIFQSSELPDLPDVSLSEDTYTPAEDLLPSPRSPQTDLDFQLDEAMLSQLTEDLSRLEVRPLDFQAATAEQQALGKTVFSLDGIDDLFLEDEKDLPDSAR